MSRFLYQIKYESGLSIRENNFQNQISTQKNKEITIPKTEELLEAMNIYQSGEKAISPSALNTYIECPLRFYFKYLARIDEKEEIAEELDHRLLGNIFHECSQSLYATLSSDRITTEDIDQLLHDDSLIDTHIRKCYAKIYDTRISKLIDSGSNELILNVIKKYLKEMFRYDKKICPFRMLAMEDRFQVPIELEIAEMPQTIHVGGFIDRIDQTAEGVRIIDYKTGADTTDFKTVESVFDPATPNRNKAAFQTMLYCLMYDHSHPGNQALIPGIYSVKLLFNKDYDYRLKCDKEPIGNFHRFEEEFRTHLKTLLTSLFSPEVPFTQTDNEKKCQHCTYAAICRR